MAILQDIHLTMYFIAIKESLKGNDVFSPCQFYSADGSGFLPKKSLKKRENVRLVTQMDQKRSSKYSISCKGYRK